MNTCSILGMKISNSPFNRKHSTLPSSFPVGAILLVLAFSLIGGVVPAGASKTSLGPCADLPQHFTSYAHAQQAIEGATWLIAERQWTPESSWINQIKYYSCEGQTGFLLVQIGNRTYIHANVPRRVWNEFKQAPSKGTYYNQRIRGDDRYYFRLG